MRLIVCAALSLCLIAAGCGSQLTPQEKASVLGAGGGGTGTGDGYVDGGGEYVDGGDNGGSSGGGNNGGTGGDGGTGGNPPPSRACEGTGGATDKGVTEKTIKIANASDISGPVPGLFESAQQAVKAYVAYVNSTGGICGRKLELMALDSRTDSRGDQEATNRACGEAFALVGSMSAYDQGGASAASSCGIPDLRAVTTTIQRQKTSVTYGVNSNRINYVATAQPDYFKNKYPEAVQKAAYLYLNSEVTRQNEQSFAKGYASRGFTWVYEQAIDIADFNYSPYVVEMKNRGVRYVQWLGSSQHAVRLLQAMQQQGFKPDVIVMDPVGYHPDFLKQAGSAAEGVTIFINTALLEESGGNKEMQLYRTWLGRVAPGAQPDYFGFFAWGAAKLFAELAADIGPQLTRKALLGAVSKVSGYTAGGMFSKQDVGARRTSKCWSFIRVKSGKFVRESPGSGFTCAGLIDTGVGR